MSPCPMPYPRLICNLRPATRTVAISRRTILTRARSLCRLRSYYYCKHARAVR